MNEQMATETENYSKVITTVMAFSKVLLRVLLKRVSDLTPENHDPHPWTLDHFLDKKRDIISKSKTGKEKMHTYFPGCNKPTDLSLWDLQMICFILSLMFDEREQDSLGISKLRQLRNKLCHQPNPVLTNDEYEHYMAVLQNILKDQHDFIKDKIFEEEIRRDLENLKKRNDGSASFIKYLHQWYMREREVEERLSHLEGGAFIII